MSDFYQAENLVSIQTCNFVTHDGRFLKHLTHMNELKGFCDYAYYQTNAVCTFLKEDITFLKRPLLNIFKKVQEGQKAFTV